MVSSNPRTHHRARVAALSRDRRADDPKLLAARRDLASSNIEKAIRRNLEAAPPLTDEQADRLADLLRASGVRPLGMVVSVSRGAAVHLE